MINNTVKPWENARVIKGFSREERVEILLDIERDAMRKIEKNNEKLLKSHELSRSIIVK